MIISLILAIADNGCIGKDNSLPWPRISEDMKWFKTHTTDKIVLMGSKTWYSLPKKPLPNRVNVVASSKLPSTFRDGDLGAEPEMVVNGSAEEMIAKIQARWPDQQELMIIGGAEIYKLFRPLADRMYVTRIGKAFDGDCFLNIDLAEVEFEEPFFEHLTKTDGFEVVYEIRERKV